MSQAMEFCNDLRQAVRSPMRSDSMVASLDYSNLILKVPSVSLRVPDHLQLGSLNDRRFRVLSPLTVQLSRDKDSVTAEAQEIGEFGVGKTTTEAILDLQVTVVELYATLEAEQDRLGRDLLEVWSILKQKIARER
jgi:hypothetical protein